MPSPENPNHHQPDDQDEMFGLPPEDMARFIEASLLNPTADDELLYAQLTDEEQEVCIVVATAAGQSAEVSLLAGLGYSENVIQSLVDKQVLKYISAMTNLKAWEAENAAAYEALIKKMESVPYSKLSPAEKSFKSSWDQNQRLLMIVTGMGGGAYHFVSVSFAKLVLDRNPSLYPKKRK